MVFHEQFWECKRGEGRLTHCGEAAGDCLGALQSWRVEEEDIVRAEEVEAIASEPLFQAIILINCPMKDSSWVHQGQNVAQVPFLFFGVRSYWYVSSVSKFFGCINFISVW